MSLVDSAALWTNRLNANAPQIATLGFSQAYNYGLSLLSAFEDGQYLLNANAANISVLSATGSALDLLGANFGVYRQLGTSTALIVVFSTQIAVTNNPVVILPGQLVGTNGNNISVPQLTYKTQTTATIPVGSTTSNGVLAICQTPGTLGNVAAGTIVLMQTAMGGVQVTNNPSGFPLPTSYTQADSYGQILGTDREDDGPYRLRIIAALAIKYGTTAMNLALQAVSMPEQLSALGDTSPHNYNPWDTYVYDPQTGTGFIYYAWALPDGSAPGLPAGATTAVADGVTYVVLGSNHLSDYALAEDTAIRAVAPANTVPRIMAVGGVTSPFNVVAVTSMVAKITVPSSVQINTSTFADPASLIIKQGFIAYIQSLLHNQPPTVGGAAAFVVSYCANYSIPVNFAILTTVNGTNLLTTPISAGTATAPILYRCTGATSIVTLSIGYL